MGGQKKSRDVIRNGPGVTLMIEAQVTGDKWRTLCRETAVGVISDGHL